MGLFDRIFSSGAFTHEQLRSLFLKGPIEVECCVPVHFFDGWNSAAFFIHLATGEGGFFRTGANGKPYWLPTGTDTLNWGPKWGLEKPPQPLNPRHSRRLKQDQKDGSVFLFTELGVAGEPPQIIRMGKSWSFWSFSFHSNLNSLSGSTVSTFDFAFNAVGAQLEGVFKKIPVF